MRIMVASDNDNLSYYLQDAGYITKNMYVNDMALEVARQFEADVVIYQTTITPTIPHEDAISAMRAAGFRIVLATDPATGLIPYAAALGVTDILIFPINPEDVLFRIENPATVAEVADVVREIGLNTKRDKDGMRSDKKTGAGGKEEQNWFKRLCGVRTTEGAFSESASNQPNSSMVEQGQIITNDISLVERITKDSKHSHIIIDADLSTTNILNLYDIESSEVWEHDWRLGLSAKPFRVDKKTMLYTTSEKGVEVTERDIRAMSDIIDSAIPEKKNIIIYYSDIAIKKALQKQLKEADKDDIR